MNTHTSSPHISVMLKETIDFLAPKDGEIIVDGTFGAGGHSRAILDTANCRVFGIDRDPAARSFSENLSHDFPNRFVLLEGPFSDMDFLLAKHGVSQVDGILLDIGVSSMQIDQAERGFSFMQDGPLDMRMGNSELTAADIVNLTEENELADIIFKYGDEPDSRRIAKAICNSRKEKAITSTHELAVIVRSAIRKYPKHIDPATRTFQALRIWVNDELGELEKALEKAELLLKPGGRLVVITFHSLEDKIVKEFLNTRSEKKRHVNKYAVNQERDASSSLFELLTRKAVCPSDEEVKHNFRARSAKLRAALRRLKKGEL
ncbi:MAG: 16S rRNA (cytosine(1402)-N(4))-methyltransferase RsmH [Alphaproteobacteria bacterium]|nr:16S rRNA (cytosine(1402)-N(4))-methyltransferase RsmH [Alphaproteobacteria bacterium]